MVLGVAGLGVFSAVTKIARAYGVPIEELVDEE
jgi:hypothetical protein